MFRGSKTQSKFKTYKSDAAPFFFFIDIYPLDLEIFKNRLSSLLDKHITNNPIMPLPMRIDRVFNGDNSIVIRPNLPVSFPINKSTLAVVNPIPFLQWGIEKLIFFTEIRSQEQLFRPLNHKKACQWWENTRFLYGNLLQVEEDFSAFLKAYLYTIIKALVNEEDITGAAIKYCEIINDICKEKILRNKIIVETKGIQESVKLYQEKTGKSREKLKVVKKVEYHPELIDIEVYNFINSGFPKQEEIKNLKCKNYDNVIVKYIPLLLYDDLHECMLQNLRILEMNEIELLDPSVLLKKQVILLLNSEEPDNINLSKYSWLTDLSEVDIGVILNSIIQSLKVA